MNIFILLQILTLQQDNGSWGNFFTLINKLSQQKNPSDS